MAYNIQPLGGFNVGNALSDALAQRDQRAKQQQMQELSQRAAQGDTQAIEQLYAINPNAAQAFEQRMFEGQQREAEQQQFVEDARTSATVDFIEKLSFMEPEQQQAAFNMAVDDERFDIDEEDRELFSRPEYQQAVIAQVKGKDYADRLFGGDEASKTAKQKDFETYQRLKKDDPEAAKTFGSGAGFVFDDKKRIFKIEDGIKYFSDGTEQPVGPKDKLKTEDMRTAMSQEQALKVIDKAKEGQLKNAGFALTMNDGLSTVNKMVSEGYDPTSAGWINKYLAGTTIGNLAMSEQDQTFVGSVEQMINAIARRETGAAITEFEKKDFFNRYMPVAGDKPARIKQKKEALERQFKSIRGQAGSVYDAIRVTQGFDTKKENVSSTSMTRDQYDKLPVGSEYEIDGVKYIKGQ